MPSKEIFRFAGPHPLQGQFPQYIYVIGPFRTLRGAKCMLHLGTGNPHIQHVNDAERIGKLYAEDLAERNTYIA